MRYFIVFICMPVIQKIVSRLLGWVTPYLMPLFSITGAASFWLSIFGVFLKQLIANCLFVMVLYRKERYLPKKELQTNKPGGILYFAAVGFLLQFIGIVCNAVMAVFLKKLGLTVPSSPLMIPQTVWQYTAQIAVACLAPAVFEEVLFRRFVFDHIRGYSRASAVIFSALFFATAHYDFFNFPATFLVGLVLGVFRAGGAPLLYCITTHFATNCCATILNVALENAVIASFFNRYLILIFVLALVFIFLLLPKHKIFCISSEEFCSEKQSYIKALLVNPLFYVYIFCFLVLGVKSL